MIVTGNGSFQTQRQHPKMALIRLALESDGFILSAPNMNDIKVPFTPVGKERIMCRYFKIVTIPKIFFIFEFEFNRVWNMHVPGLSYSQEIGQWFSKYLEK